MNETLTRKNGTIAYDDHGGDGRLLLLLPGAGDVRSEHRFLVEPLVDAGHRVVTADLRGHGDSSAPWPSYGIAETAEDIVALIQDLGGGPATVIANSFAPAAAMWAAAEHPDLIDGVVAISPHLDQAAAAQRFALKLMMRGPFAGSLWARFYRDWYKASPPQDLDEQVALLRSMMASADRRKAVRETLVAHRNGVDERLARLDAPVLTIFGGADDHFPDPEAEAASVAKRTRGSFQMVPDAGHYPHVERPDLVAPMILDFLAAG